MKKFLNPVYISIIIGITLAYVFALSTHAQNVVQNGKMFIEQQPSSKRGEVKKTDYLYKDSKGRVDTVYLSSTGKAFVYWVSKNGKQYKKYLPEVTKQINPNAYEQSKSKRRDN